MRTLRWGLGLVSGAGLLLATGCVSGPGSATAAVSTGSAEAAATYPGDGPVTDPQSLVAWCQVGESVTYGGWSVRPAHVGVEGVAAAVDVTASRSTTEETEHGPRDGWLVDFTVGDLAGQDTTVAVVVTCER